jgi:hypothetical protein
LTVGTKQSFSRSQSVKRRFSPVVSSTAARCESRRPIGNGCSGDTAAFTAGTCCRKAVKVSTQLSPGWMLLQ